MRKKVKKMVCLFLSVSMAFGILSDAGWERKGNPVKVQAAAADENGFVIENNILVSYVGKGGKVVIPDGVTQIGYHAFWKCNEVTEVEIPDSVTTIEKRAFESCEGLTSVEIPDSVTTMGSYAFGFCRTLTSVKMSHRITTIEEAAFCGCVSLTEIEIPDSVTVIGDRAFDNCDSLANIKIPDSVTTIGDYSFSSCKNLINIKIPDGVMKIGKSAFGFCDTMEEIWVSENNQNYSSEEGVFFNKEKTELLQYPIGKQEESYKIPDSVEKIGDRAFYSCKSLTNVEIPNGVMTIGNSAFGFCKGLICIQIPKSVTNIGSGAFGYCNNMTEILVEADNQSYSSEDGVLFNKEKTRLFQYPEGKRLEVYKIPEGIERIEGWAFRICYGLKNIEIPDSVTVIEDCAFYDCINLEKFIVSEENKAFVSVEGVLYTKDRKKLVQYPVAKKEALFQVVSIFADKTYDSYSGIAKLDNEPGNDGREDVLYVEFSIKYAQAPLSESVLNPFHWTVNGTQLPIGTRIQNGIEENGKHISNGITIFLSDGMIQDIKNTTVELKPNVKDITGRTLSGQTKFTTPMILEGSIFADDINIIGTDVKAARETQDQSAGRETEYKVLKETETIGYGAFSNAENLEKITLPDGLKTIEGLAFESCTGLVSMEIPSETESIGEQAFQGCSSLAAVAVPDNVTIYDSENVFSGTSDDFTIYCYEDSAMNDYAEKYGYKVSVVDAGADVGEAMRKELEKGKAAAGDVNNDGQVNSEDALTILKIAAELLTPSEEQEQAADVNGDGRINSEDALLVLKYAAGLLHYPAENTKNISF